MSQLHAGDLEESAHLTDFVRRVDDELIPGASLPTVRDDFSRGDVAAMTEHPSRTRQWLELHSRIGDDERYADIVRQVYRAYDDRLRPSLLRELDRRGRRLRDSITVDDLLRALTALTEGTAVRVLAENLDEAARAGAVAGAAAEAVIMGLTEPVPD
ncbi:hypothetical protein [Nocardioides sp. Root190]|uniref:hypothetical protein n=1 Tax=Nocardioides sp. Root190 TaxID=1736488 RepID=UPI0012F74B30|nr:hypothetical protein [Nocardioides sp. Root190]